MITINGTFLDLIRFIKDRNYPKYAVLLLSPKTDLPMGAYAPDGGAGGKIWSRRSLQAQSKKDLTINDPSHCYSNNDRAYRILMASVKKGKNK